MTPAHRRTLALRFIGIAAGLTLGTAGMLAWDGELLVPSGAIVFLVGAVVGEWLPIRQPYGATLPMSLAVLGAMALIGTPPHVLAAFAGAAWIIGAIGETYAGRKVEGANLPRRLVGAWSLSAIALLLSSVPVPEWAVITPASLDGPAVGLNTLAAAAIALVIILGVPLTESVMAEARVNVPLHLRLRDAFNSTWQATVAIAATAALGAMVHPVLGAWTVPLMLAPLWAARLGVRRHRIVTDAYDQTIRAMSRLPEQLGSLAPGHGVRVGRLALAVSNELGLPDRQVGTIERAAYLHQIGRVPLEDDSPSPDEIAVTGAGIVREAGDLDDVAAIVEATGDVGALIGRHDQTAIGARIVYACSVIDQFAPDYRDHGQVNDVMVRLVREVGDIDVVAALSRVANRALHPATT